MLSQLNTMLPALLLSMGLPLVAAQATSEPYPKLSTFPAFTLSAVVDGSVKDGSFPGLPGPAFDPPIDGMYLTSLHDGAGTALAQLSLEPGRIFYQNGTEEGRRDTNTVITDGGTPPFPESLIFAADPNSPDASVLRIDAGSGSPGISIGFLPDLELRTTAVGTFVACLEPVAYYGGRNFTLIKHIFPPTAVPAECLPIHLQPKCARLNELPPDAYSKHDSILPTQCFF